MISHPFVSRFLYAGLNFSYSICLAAVLQSFLFTSLVSRPKKLLIEIDIHLSVLLDYEFKLN